MKVIKELPLSLLKTAHLLSIPASRLKKRNATVVPVIISLTSIPSRLQTVHLVIRSLLVQEVSPKKIVLWLNDTLKDHIPRALQQLVSERFEIHYSPLDCPHLKLIHTLKAFPNEVIITCDDDVMYRKNWLSLLYNEHKKQPKMIVANHTIHINHDSDGNPLPFKKWRYPKTGKTNPWAITPLGHWGVVYPPNTLSETVWDESLLLQLAPKADDLWFKAMALLQGTPSVQATHIPKKTIPILGTQKVALKRVNLGQDKNTSQWNALNTHFNLSARINQS